MKKSFPGKLTQVPPQALPSALGFPKNRRGRSLSFAAASSGLFLSSLFRTQVSDGRKTAKAICVLWSLLYPAAAFIKVVTPEHSAGDHFKLFGFGFMGSVYMYQRQHIFRVHGMLARQFITYPKVFALYFNYLLVLHPVGAMIASGFHICML
jgi:hypothetical protein